MASYLLSGRADWLVGWMREKYESKMGSFVLIPSDTEEVGRLQTPNTSKTVCMTTNQSCKRQKSLYTDPGETTE